MRREQALMMLGALVIVAPVLWFAVSADEIKVPAAPMIGAGIALTAVVMAGWCIYRIIRPGRAR